MVGVFTNGQKLANEFGLLGLADEGQQEVHFEHVGFNVLNDDTHTYCMRAL